MIPLYVSYDPANFDSFWSTDNNGTAWFMSLPRRIANIPQQSDDNTAPIDMFAPIKIPMFFSGIIANSIVVLGFSFVLN